MNSTPCRCTLFALLTFVWAGSGFSVEPASPPVTTVLHISVDGLVTSYLQSLLDAGELPNFRRLQTEGSWTNNVRTDYDYTITLPNHTCMVTGRPVMDRTIDGKAIEGHLWTTNVDPGEEDLHRNRHAYMSSVFDVAHDHGLHTGLFASKSKFVLYDQSYDDLRGALDTIEEDNGRDKIDVYHNDKNSAEIITQLAAAMKEKPLNYAFIHLHDCDTAGHGHGWGGDEYNAAAQAVDAYLGTVFELVTSMPELKDKTVIILSADHGGFERNHQNNANPLDYTIPFYVWGAGVAQGKDLYALNPESRENPGTERPDYGAAHQPIRNGDGGNLALKLLGLKAIDGSFINARQDLAVH